MQVHRLKRHTTAHLSLVTFLYNPSLLHAILLTPRHKPGYFWYVCHIVRPKNITAWDTQYSAHIQQQTQLMLSAIRQGHMHLWERSVLILVCVEVDSVQDA